MAADPIISDLQYVMETNQELDILNFHKGFPITSKARVERINKDNVVLKVQPPGSVCLEAQDQTIVLSRGLPEAVRAHVISFDLANGLLTLDDFNYVGGHFGERMIARVQPEDTITVEIESDGKSTSGILVDVSLSGVGIYVDQPTFQRSQIVQLTLPLPEGKVMLPGKILNVNEMNNGKVRLAVGFTRNAQEIALIMRYIRDRRMEILNEVEHMYERAYRQKLAQKEKQE